MAFSSFQNIYFSLNELAIVNDWSIKINAGRPLLFFTDDTYTKYHCDLLDFTKLHEMVEGVEHTPKVRIVMEKLAELIISEIPEISQQGIFIDLTITNRWTGTTIRFTDDDERHYIIL